MSFFEYHRILVISFCVPWNKKGWKSLLQDLHLLSHLTSATTMLGKNCQLYSIKEENEAPRGYMSSQASQRAGSQDSNQVYLVPNPKTVILTGANQSKAALLWRLRQGSVWPLARPMWSQFWGFTWTPTGHSPNSAKMCHQQLAQQGPLSCRGPRLCNRFGGVGGRPIEPEYIGSAPPRESRERFSPAASAGWDLPALPHWLRCWGRGLH